MLKLPLFASCVTLVRSCLALFLVKDVTVPGALLLHSIGSWAESDSDPLMGLRRVLTTVDTFSSYSAVVPVKSALCTHHVVLHIHLCHVFGFPGYLQSDHVHFALQKPLQNRLIKYLMDLSCSPPSKGFWYW